MTARAREHGESGFTVIELLCASFLSLLVFAAAISLFQTHARLALQTQADLAAVDGAAWALQVASRDLSLAGADPARAGIPALALATEDEVVVQRDEDADGAVDPGSAERTALSWSSASGGRMMRQLGAQPMNVAAAVPSGGFVLRYYDREGNELAPSGALDEASRARVRRVGVELTVEERIGALEARSRLRAAAALRIVKEEP